MGIEKDTESQKKKKQKMEVSLGEETPSRAEVNVQSKSNCSLYILFGMFSLLIICTTLIGYLFIVGSSTVKS